MIKRFLIELSVTKPKLIKRLSLLITLIFLAAFPSLKTDTDPVKMLPQDNPAITLYKEVKAEFSVNDLVVLGITSKDGSSLFTKEAMGRIHQITKEIVEIQDEPQSNTAFMQFFRKLQFLKEHKVSNTEDLEIFIKNDVIAVSQIDDIIKTKNEELTLVPLMENAPKTDVEAKAVLDRLNTNPIFAGKLAAKDGSLVGIFLPLKNGKKERSYYLGEEMKKIAEKYLGPNEKYYLAGLPIAENTFGNEMFVQMGLYAPAAGLVIFLLMLFFFRSVKLVAAPMLLGMMVIIWSMGALIYSGNSIHIMSSMIPIFLLPIAVLNSIHIMSRLHDAIPRHEHRADAIREVMYKLFNPMFFTTVTTIVGFASLATTGIPPIMVFGVTIALGVFLSWLMSMLYIPAYTMGLSKEALSKFGSNDEDKKSVVMEIVQMFKGIANQAPHVVMWAVVIAVVVSYFGLQKIIINDNPVRWFKEGHVLRDADKVMNHKLAGTYLANLYFEIPVVEAEEVDEDDFDSDFAEDTGPAAPSIKDPAALIYLDKVSNFLLSIQNEKGEPRVGGVNSVIDIMRKIGKVAFDDASIPATRELASQYLFLFESGDKNKGKDLWKFITPGESTKSQMWVLFKTGDNQNTIEVVNALDKFMAENPPPKFALADGSEVQLKVQWTGLTYINKVWQDEMVTGMLWALAGSFLIVFGMMVFLFRSLVWGVISMLPLTLTIMLIYGAIGYMGKFYDMPIAVLSSLTLGLSVDFAIHFIESVRETQKETQDANKTFFAIFDGTAQAIWRNVLVISIGFMPLFFSGLVPYITVGSFFFAIMLVSGVSTLILLPVIVRIFSKWLPGFKEAK